MDFLKQILKTIGITIIALLGIELVLHSKDGKEDKDKKLVDDKDKELKAQQDTLDQKAAFDKGQLKVLEAVKPQVPDLTPQEAVKYWEQDEKTNKPDTTT